MPAKPPIRVRNKPPPAAGDPNRRQPVDKGGPNTASFADVDYSAEELEVLKAVEAFKKKHRIRYPSLTDTLKVLRALGWRKVGGDMGGQTGGSG